MKGQPRKEPLLTYDGELARPVEAESQIDVELGPQPNRVAGLAIELVMILIWLILGVLIFSLLSDVPLLIVMVIYLASVALTVYGGHKLTEFSDNRRNTADTADYDDMTHRLSTSYWDALQASLRLFSIVPSSVLRFVLWVVEDQSEDAHDWDYRRGPGPIVIPRFRPRGGGRG
jgi:hypothetical protein